MPVDTGPSYEPEQELRLALVLYGGVSLAIYMYGVADELYKLVRATAPVPAGGMPDAARALAFPEAPGTEAVYRRLGQLLPLQDGEPPSEAPVRTRFVVDLIAGTSAGGINGICLAKALANETVLDGLAELWLDEGDLATLMNDEATSAMYKGRTFYYQPPPASLLDGRRMTALLVTALETMNSSSEDPVETRLVDELDLWVTATDLEGLEVPIKLSRGAASERRHRHRSHFRFDRNEGRNDFQGADSDFLAYAARCTASFPSAFEPMQLDALGGLGVQLQDWRRYHSSYPDDSQPPFRGRAFSDGGILDNKPFTYVTEALRRRRATLPVVRKLLYVEPDPASPADAKPPRASWNILDTVQAALLGIPRTEGIREDIQSVLARNRSIERVRELVATAGTTAQERELLLDLATARLRGAWGELTLAQTADLHPWGPAYTTYYRLKVRGVVDFLAGLIVGAAGLDPESDDAFAVHYLVRAWKNERYVEAPPADLPDGPASTNRFLVEYDLPYRIRRLTFVIDKLKRLRRGDRQPLELPLSLLRMTPDEASVPAPEELTRLMADLDGLRSRLADTERTLVAGGQLGSAVAGAGITRAVLARCLEPASEWGMLDVATRVVSENADSFAQAAELISTAVGAATRAASERIDGSEDEPGLLPPVNWEVREATADPVAAALRFYYDTYEAYDAVLFPIQYATGLGDTNPVDILRVSPLDATSPQDLTGPARDLYGMRLAHFGAFFDRSWRHHDIVWGRLNGSECLIRGLLPPDHPEVEPLIEQAHRAIVAAYAEELGVPAEQDPSTWFTDYRPPALGMDATNASVGRLARIVARLGDGLIRQRTGTPAEDGSTALKTWTALTRLLAPGNGRALGIVDRALAAFVWRPLLLLAAIVLAPVAAGAALVVATDDGWSILGWTLVGAGLALAAVAIAVLWSAAWGVGKLRGFVLGRLEKLLEELRKER